MAGPRKEYHYSGVGQRGQDIRSYLDPNFTVSGLGLKVRIRDL